MRTYAVKGKDHVVYDSIEEFPDTMRYLKDWRDGDLGDWILADDGCIIQVLRVGTFAKPKGKIRTLKYASVLSRPWETNCANNCSLCVTSSRSLTCVDGFLPDKV